MSDIKKYTEKIDTSRLRRAKELSELKIRMAEMNGISKYGINSKALIVLSYAHWEGFYNECVNHYVDALRDHGNKVGEISWSLLIGILKPELQRLRDRNHSFSAEVEFIDSLRGLIDNDFSKFDNSVVMSRSNLDFDKLAQNFKILGFNLTPFQRWRIKINKELVGWRNSVAHGDEPDLSSVDFNSHVQLTQNLLLMIADTFQTDMEEKCCK